ncbi:hypothetical protein CMEL01_09358 [Colletotrichum melonis]|uniref:Uncharacterized protein n=1 Tax=Colletotrichum melonis TaxID=1209925 RepID=A0AAI9TX00_9PEZI|nr:hypothetical protein CMEL01_09358 [Colletotrichum melonis]
MPPRSNNGSSSRQPPAQQQQQQPHNSSDQDIDLRPLEQYNHQHPHDHDFGPGWEYRVPQIPALPNNGFNVPSNAMRPQMGQQQAQLPASNVMPNQNFNLPLAQYIEPNNQQFNNQQNNYQ